MGRKGLKLFTTGWHERASTLTVSQLLQLWERFYWLILDLKHTDSVLSPVNLLHDWGSTEITCSESGSCCTGLGARSSAPINIERWRGNVAAAAASGFVTSWRDSILGKGTCSICFFVIIYKAKVSIRIFTDHLLGSLLSCFVADSRGFPATSQRFPINTQQHKYHHPNTTNLRTPSSCRSESCFGFECAVFTADTVSIDFLVVWDLALDFYKMNYGTCTYRFL